MSDSTRTEDRITDPYAFSNARLGPGRRIRLVETQDPGSSAPVPGATGTIVGLLVRDRNRGDMSISFDPVFIPGEDDIAQLKVEIEWDDARLASVLIPPDVIEVVG